MKRSAELEDLTRQLYAAITTGNVGFFERHLWQGENCIVIGSAPGEWWNDAQSVLEAMRAQMATAGNSIHLRAGDDLAAYTLGAAGWVADRPMLRVGSVEVECRHTAVFIREGDEWRMVQHHFSLPVPNEQVFGADAAKLG